jgi:hypothetical protein
MAGRAIIDDEQEEIGIAFRQFPEEHIHASTIHRGQDEVAGVPIKRAYRAIGIRVFADDLCRHVRPASFGRPTILRFVDASEPGFVLKEHFERLTYCFGFTSGFLKDVRPVFLKASAAARSDLGCLGRGAIFRQP